VRLSAIRATTAEVQGELLRLLARLRVDHDLAYRHPTVVAGVGALVLVLAFGGWVRWMRGRLIHVNTSSVLAAPPGSLDPPAGASYVVNTRIVSWVY